MAAIRGRRRSDGSTGYTVTWRLGGARAGAQQSETFDDDPAAAEAFRRAVEKAGHQWPPGWVKGAGYVHLAATVPALVVATPVAPAPVVALPPPTPVHRLADFGMQFARTRTGIGPDTRTLYARHAARMDAWLTPIVGGPPMVETLDRDHIRLLVNAREAAGAAPKTIRNYHGLLFSIMEYAIERRLRDDNPCRGTRLPEPQPIDPDTDEEIMVFLTEAEFDLIARCLADDPVARAIAIVAVGTGLRFGEITALQARDLDDDGPVLRISVRRAWKNNGRGEFAIPGYGPRYLGKPKSRASRRRVSAAPVVAEVLRRAAAGKARDELLFTGVTGGPIEEHFTDRRWATAINAAGALGLRKRPRFHDLRHTHAAWLISAGVPLPVIQKRLGHESITTTVDVYGGLLDQAHEAADAAIEAALVHGRVPSPRPQHSATMNADNEVTLDPDDDARPEIDLPEVA